MLKKIITMLYGQHKSIEAEHANTITDLDESPQNLIKTVSHDTVLCQNMLLGISTVDFIRRSILSTREHLMVEKDKLVELNQQNDVAISSLQTLVCQISETEEKSTDIEGRMAVLKSNLSDIDNCINQIQRIANQTNLIAINSAIEAARVGESGRGFSVIAQEVRSLAENVKVSAKNVSQLTAGVQENTTNVGDALCYQKSMIAIITDNVNQVVESIRMVIEKSERMRKVIENVTSIQFLNVVKIDHVVWKMELYKILMDRNKEATVTRYDSCRMGKWYYSAEGQKLSHYTSFRNLEQPHKTLHDSGYRAIQYFNEGNTHAMSTELKKMEDASNEVVSFIEMLGAEIIR